MSSGDSHYKSPIDGYALNVFQTAFRQYTEGNIVPLKYRKDAAGDNSIYQYICNLTPYETDASTHKVMATIFVSANGDIGQPQVSWMG